jgi:hypothetical protein
VRPEFVRDIWGFEELPKIANEITAIAQEKERDNIESDDVTELL